MRVLLSTVGTRGEVQPVVAVAARLRFSGHEAVVCAPPDFRAWVESLGIPFVPVGPELRGTAEQGERVLPTPEQRRQMIDGTVAAQFAAVAAGADGCDVIVGGGALAVAAHSVAEHRGIGYVYASFCPITLPSPHHAPPVFGVLGEKQPDGAVDNATLWAEDAQRWNLMWGEAINSRRAELGLAPVTDVRDHIFTATPWLAADPTLAPWPDANDPDVLQTGPWILSDDRPLDPEIEAFLNAGEPPVYLGFGSIRAPGDITSNVVEAARAMGRRTIVSRGWTDLAPVDGAPDCLAIGEVNQQALFPRVAAVVHHGGAGTTTAAAAAGTPQVLVPQVYDQFYFARRVEELGVGRAHREGGSLHAALASALGPEVATTARALASAVRTDGATTAARRLVEMTRIA
jgi:vancomycin aglycone glucosyltransferase